MKKRLFVATAFVFCGLAAIAFWWEARPAPEAPIPIVWTASTLPAVPAMIDGKPCLLTLSTADKFFLSLDENGMECLADKTPCGTATWRDPKGNSYESPSLHVKSVELGHLKVLNVIAQGTYTKDNQKSIVWESPQYKKDDWPKTSGNLGQPLLAKTNLLLDLGHDRIIASNCTDSFKKYGVNLDLMKKFSLEPEERGIILKIDTDVGSLRLDINTGATISVIRSSLLEKLPERDSLLKNDWRGLSYFTTALSIDSTSIGRQEIYPIELSDQITWFDGCLGVDFLKKHIVYIDYPNKAVYIS